MVGECQGCNCAGFCYSVLKRKQKKRFKMSIGQISLVCLIKAKETTKPLVREELKHLAEMTHKEKGNINYDLHVSNADDGLFILYENWKDQAALDSHMNQPYLKSFLGKTEELLERPIDAKLCTKI
jgi:quinol monooxygenase YgiN